MSNHDWTHLLNRPPLADGRAVKAQERRARPEFKEHARSKLEREWLLRWSQLGGPTLVEQYRFHPDRRWRLDFAHPATRIGIELHGGTFIQGRHTRGAGFAGDREKINAALDLGWRVYEFVSTDWANVRAMIERTNHR